MTAHPEAGCRQSPLSGRDRPAEAAPKMHLQSRSSCSEKPLWVYVDAIACSGSGSSHSPDGMRSGASSATQMTCSAGVRPCPDDSADQCLDVDNAPSLQSTVQAADTRTARSLTLTVGPLRSSWESRQETGSGATLLERPRRRTSARPNLQLTVPFRALSRRTGSRQRSSAHGSSGVLGAIPSLDWITSRCASAYAQCFSGDAVLNRSA